MVITRKIARTLLLGLVSSLLLTTTGCSSLKRAGGSVKRAAKAAYSELTRDEKQELRDQIKLLDDAGREEYLRRFTDGEDPVEIVDDIINRPQQTNQEGNRGGASEPTGAVQQASSPIANLFVTVDDVLLAIDMVHPQLPASSNGSLLCLIAANGRFLATDIDDPSYDIVDWNDDVVDCGFDIG